MKKINITLIIIPIILFIMLAISIHAGISVRFENWIYSEATEHMSPILNSILKVITNMGDIVVIIAICFTLLIIPTKRKKYGIPCSIVVITSAIINVLLKEVFSRERPDFLKLVTETSYSFPSGHAMINASLYTMLVILVNKYVKNKITRVTLTIVFCILPLIIGFSRVYLGVHYPSDVIGGWLLGFAIAVIVYLVSDKRATSKKVELT